MTTPDTLAAVDVHAHLVPPGLLDAVRAGEFPGLAVDESGGAPLLAAGPDRLGPAGRDITDVATRLRWMDEHSIAEQWVSPWIDLFTWHAFGAGEGRRWAAATNEALAGCVRAGQGRLRLVPAVDLSAGPGAAADDVTALAERFDSPAVLLSTHPAGASSAADESLAPLWARLEEFGRPVLLHPPGNGPAQRLVPPVMQNVAGRLIDTSSAVLRLMDGGLFERHPGLRVIVVHGGGLLPYQAFRLDGLARAGLLARTGMTEPPSRLLRRLFFDTVALDAPSIEFLVRRVGADRVLLGSDRPFPIADPDPVGTLRGADLPAAVKRGICCENARALAARPGGGETER
ncbi:MAG TPA: amidohydrolase family protein [Streptosporangiaceae bacterium]|nr:amidohydrolase family protein [Streptosporangiaceae bacterium]